MTILAAEVKFYKSAEVSDAITNGGLMSAIQSVSNVSENVFPSVPLAERTAGSTKYRKLFAKIASVSNETLQNSKIYLTQPSPGDDVVTIFAATQTDVQDDITGSEDHFGSGSLNASVLAGVTSIDVLVEDDSLDRIFRIGETIRISDQATVGGAGNEEYRELTGVSYVGDVASLSFASGLANPYDSSDSYVSSGVDAGNIVGSFDGFVVTSSAGAYDDSGSPVAVDSIAGIEDTITLTFTSATAFTAVGANAGALGSGTLGSDFSPNNADFGEPYFTLLSAGFSGTFAASDTIVFNTHPASFGIWYKRTVPSGAAALSGNTVRTMVYGENV